MCHTPTCMPVMLLAWKNLNLESLAFLRLSTLDEAHILELLQKMLR